MALIALGETEMVLLICYDHEFSQTVESLAQVKRRVKRHHVSLKARLRTDLSSQRRRQSARLYAT
jgi:hypothetical protein